MAEDHGAARWGSDHITSFAQSSSVPGYLEAAAHFNLYGPTFRAGWNGLNLFTAAQAEEFMKDKLEAVTAAYEKGTTGEETALEVVFAFAVMAIFADRADREARDIDRRLEHEETAKPDIPF